MWRNVVNGEESATSLLLFRCVGMGDEVYALDSVSIA